MPKTPTHTIVDQDDKPLVEMTDNSLHIIDFKKLNEQGHSIPKRNDLESIRLFAKHIQALRDDFIPKCPEITETSSLADRLYHALSTIYGVGVSSLDSFQTIHLVVHPTNDLHRLVHAMTQCRTKGYQWALMLTDADAPATSSLSLSPEQGRFFYLLMIMEKVSLAEEHAHVAELVKQLQDIK
jgi:hypothetical protein